jgi:hypothetical protein
MSIERRRLSPSGESAVWALLFVLAVPLTRSPTHDPRRALLQGSPEDAGTDAEFGAEGAIEVRDVAEATGERGVDH